MIQVVSTASVSKHNYSQMQNKSQKIFSIKKGQFVGELVFDLRLNESIGFCFGGKGKGCSKCQLTGTIHNCNIIPKLYRNEMLLMSEISF